MTLLLQKNRYPNKKKRLHFCTDVLIIRTLKVCPTYLQESHRLLLMKVPENKKTAFLPTEQ